MTPRIHADNKPISHNIFWKQVRTSKTIITRAQHHLNFRLYGLKIIILRQGRIPRDHKCGVCSSDCAKGVSRGEVL